MPIAESTAAIISAIIAASTTAATEIGKAAAAEGSYIFGVINNQSSLSFEVDTFKPNHGSRVETPNHELLGRGWLEDHFKQTVKYKYGENFSTNQEGELRADWITNHVFDDKAKQCCIQFSGKGDGMGFECLYLLRAREKNIGIALLPRKIPGGSYGIGAWIFPLPFEVGFMKLDWPTLQKVLNPDGKIMIDGIKNHNIEEGKGNSICQFSDGGPSFELSYNNIIVEVGGPGVENKISIKDA